ncbi:hypothetical protein HCZ30_14475 [Marivivens donghaensis]|uniref:Uncharacterized protein n=1 Tax=Marivivens donghaensis TaxID=1699413 RepID=A0ABX0W2C7_9RHOB|nr:hypothetical protein [Marivivens donghaensis]NIY73636.1 hypothetical protein [Marivivens donghaensis]
MSESEFEYTSDIDGAFANSSATVVIPFESPLVRMRDAIASGTSSQDALKGWTDEAKAVLEAIRQNRRRATLVDASLLAAGDQGLVAALSERLGVEMTGEGENGRLSAEELIPLGAILKSDEAALQIAQELEAMHVGPVQIRLHELLTDVEASERLLRGIARLQELETERPLLTENMELSSTRLAEYGQERELLVENIQLLNEALQSAESLASDGEKRIQTFKNEVERQRAQAKLLEVEVKSLKQRLDEVKADKKQREAVLAVSLAEVDRARIDAENRLRDVHASTSWYVTKPLRFFRRLFG